MNDQDIVGLYREGNTLRQIAMARGVRSIDHVLTVLKNCPESGYYPNRRRSRRNKYFYDEHFFDTIDTQEKAYFLGLFVADGWLKRLANGVYTAVCYELVNDDREILDALANLLGENAPLVKTRTSKDYNRDKARLIFHSATMCKALTDRGLNNNKSFEAPRMSRHIPVELHRHYVRGYFDGNGSAVIEKYRLRISFRGNLETMLDLRAICPVYFSLNTNQWPRVQTSKHSSAVELFYWMYENATVYLSRKYDKCVSGLVR